MKICTQTNTHTFCGVSDENRDLLDTLSSIIISMIPTVYNIHHLHDGAHLRDDVRRGVGRLGDRELSVGQVIS